MKEKHFWQRDSNGKALQWRKKLEICKWKEASMVNQDRAQNELEKKTVLGFERFFFFWSILGRNWRVLRRMTWSSSIKETSSEAEVKED